ncbi:MAG: oligosaccharide flippase family protein [Bacilli bacterium]|nr:oligosaccharide flippase family protein [Bacilli bacterium]
MKKNKLLQNTIFLYILTFSSYFFNFISVPYLTRVLGPSLFGKVGLAIAISTYFKLLFDFGFILSATEEVSNNREDKKRISKILTSVNILKILLIVVGLIVFVLMIVFFPSLRKYKLLYFLYFVYVAIDCFQPDFVYRGIEEMKIITIRNVCIKAFFTALIFILLKDKSQYMLIPVFNICGSFFSLIAVYIHVIKKLKINFIKVTKEEVKERFNSSKIFFLSRIATTIYGATNTFILGIIYPTGNTLGYYTSSDKILQAGRSMMSPISDSVYPYMVKNKDFKLIKKILITLMPIITVFGVVGFIFAKKICIIAFGSEYAGSAIVLRYMIPLIWMTLPSYILGFPTMTPLGLKKEANNSVIIGSIYQIVGIGILYLLRVLNLHSICILTITTELLILLLRIFYIVKNRNKK